MSDTLHMQAKLYFNFPLKCLSVMVDNHVEQHAATVVLTDVTFRVSEAGRQRVLRNKRKNVHSYVCGTVQMIDETWEHIPFGDYPIATYNPYKYATFVLRHNAAPVLSAKKVLISGSDVYILEA